jgi:hypothetical protein
MHPAISVKLTMPFDRVYAIDRGGEILKIEIPFSIQGGLQLQF